MLSTFRGGRISCILLVHNYIRERKKQLVFDLILYLLQRELSKLTSFSLLFDYLLFLNKCSLFTNVTISIIFSLFFCFCPTYLSLSEAANYARYRDLFFLHIHIISVQLS